jgi:phage head maturation protease
MKIAKTKRGDEVWNQVKEGKLNGFSVSGYFEEVAQFCKEEMFLQQVAKILSNVKE